MTHVPACGQQLGDLICTPCFPQHHPTNRKVTRKGPNLQHVCSGSLTSRLPTHVTVVVFSPGNTCLTLRPSHKPRRNLSPGNWKPWQEWEGLRRFAHHPKSSLATTRLRCNGSPTALDHVSQVCTTPAMAWPASWKITY